MEERKKITDFICSCGEVFKWKNVKWEIDKPDGFIENVHHVCECGNVHADLLILDIMASEYSCAKNDTKKLRSFIENRLGEKWELPVDDWKILDVNCLPEKFLVDKIELKDCPKYRNTLEDKIGLISNLMDGNEYEYRLLPTKKTHEELAEEPVKASHEEHSYNYTNGGHLYKEHFPVDRMKDLDEMIKDNVRRAFIAGRKSMEGE